MPKINSNGIDLFYETRGAGQPLLFVHGLGSSLRDWEAQAAEFSRAYQVITYDLRGHGQSDKPRGPYSLPQFAADAAGLLKTLGVSSAHVVGLSLGGGVAFQLALDFLALAKTMVIVNSAPELLVNTFKDRLAIWQRIVIVRLLGMRKMGEVLAPRLFPLQEHAALRAAFIERWADNDPNAYLASVRAMVGWSVKARLGTIRCPSLIISADQDYTPLALKEEYTRLIPGARLVVISNAHHATPLEKPVEFNSALQAFLEQHP